tara:strand:- start:547 stop:900 length:354 start_codon:yes stop_codon:yes gene_type:complete
MSNIFDMSNEEYLRDLAERLRNVAAEHVDGGDIDRLLLFASQVAVAPGAPVRLTCPYCKSANIDVCVRTWFQANSIADKRDPAECLVDIDAEAERNYYCNSCCSDIPHGPNKETPNA